MKLIDILVRDLPQNGGWPADAEVCAQDNDSEVCFYTAPGIHHKTGSMCWTIPHSDCVGEGLYEEIAAGKIPGIKLE